ncbi:MAG: DUF3299 domain-containing protein [Pirellulaceae bacterium]|nr:DUF3299 domain-containing protein [Pirellulaceae bacterium]
MNTTVFGAAARFLASAVLVLASSSSVSQPSASPPDLATANRPAFKELQWDDLVPKGWDPYKEMRDKNVGSLVDGSPRALQRMREMRELWDNAPTNKSLDGQAVKLPGYVVPLEETKEGLKEFLLVPYFGACVHSPPPPANQIVHVVSAKPVKGFASMDTVWVSGILKMARQDSEMGVSGYKIDALIVARYVPPAR